MADTQGENIQEDGKRRPVALSMQDISIAFGPNKVLKGVDMNLPPGTITALLGANGAGKSTLIKILSGLYSGYQGVIHVDGGLVQIDSPKQAAREGIQIVHQRIDESIIPGLTVAENLVFEEIAAGQVSTVGSLKHLLPRAREISGTLDLGWPDTVLLKDVFDLGDADSQMLLLARALSHRPKVLVLDEPTSTLSGTEVQRLFRLIRRLRDEGVAILYVSHRLSEIYSLADELIVLRDGRIDTHQTAPFDMAKAVRSMLGQDVSYEAETLAEQRGDHVAIELEGVQLLRGSDSIDLQLRYGEVTGVIGLIGAGKSELARGIFGADPLRKGRMWLDGVAYSPKSPKDAVAHKVYLVPEDRAAESMLPGWGIAHTVSLPFLRQHSLSGVMRPRLEKSAGRSVIDNYSVVATGSSQNMDFLSGGNQQKVVVARWLREKPFVMLLDEPFRGVDLGARREISSKARDQAAAGACVLVLTSDVTELREVSDRVVVMVDGEIRLDAYTSEVDDETLIARMSEVA